MRKTFVPAGVVVNRVADDRLKRMGIMAVKAVVPIPSKPWLSLPLFGPIPHREQGQVVSAVAFTPRPVVVVNGRDRRDHRLMGYQTGRSDQSHVQDKNGQRRYRVGGLYA